VKGAYEKDPKRGKAREGEPKPDGPLGEWPSRWDTGPTVIAAAELFMVGKSLNDVAAALKIEWEDARALQVASKKLADKVELRQLWEEVRLMAPWLSNADRWTVESICELKLRERRGIISTGERSELGRLCGKCGMNPSDRTRVSTLPKNPVVAKTDPREQFMKRRTSKAG
jgi:hypothetical protein